MTKHRSHRRSRSQSRSRTMRRSQHGGDLAGNPPSSWGWVSGTVGNGWTQFMNSLSLQPGQTYAAAQTNVSVPVKNASQAGGRRRRRYKGRGGNIGAVLGQAAVPGVLLLAQQSMGRRSRKHHR